MPKSLQDRLREKGWAEEEIAKTVNLLYSEEKQIKHQIFSSKNSGLIYWVGLLIAIIGNLIISVIFIPFLMILNSLQLYIVMGIMGLIFGSMFNLIIKDIERIKNQHHVYAGVLIPALALITVFVMTQVANTFNQIINNPNTHNPFIISIVYVLLFSFPYMWYKVKDIRYDHTKEIHTD